MDDVGVGLIMGLRVINLMGIISAPSSIGGSGLGRLLGIAYAIGNEAVFKKKEKDIKQQKITKRTFFMYTIIIKKGVLICNWF